MCSLHPDDGGSRRGRVCAHQIGRRASSGSGARRRPAEPGRTGPHTTYAGWKARPERILGVPRMGAPTKILQTKDEVVFLYAQQGASPTDFRIIPTDGRAHDPIRSQDLLFYGDSVGKWDGDTLVVDSVGFNDLTWMGQGGY